MAVRRIPQAGYFVMNCESTVSVDVPSDVVNSGVSSLEADDDALPAGCDGLEAANGDELAEPVVVPWLVVYSGVSVAAEAVPPAVAEVLGKAKSDEGLKKSGTPPVWPSDVWLSDVRLSNPGPSVGRSFAVPPPAVLGFGAIARCLGTSVPGMPNVGSPKFLLSGSHVGGL
ncbi:hypothetical protein [Rhodopila sp.]|uniref:hypothetical protein n=1 Tax=Rhodopila sp. TaxID=2480087 RepID=UPI003D0AFF81